MLVKNNNYSLRTVYQCFGYFTHLYLSFTVNYFTKYQQII